jgi:hypothetical protein
MQTESNEINSKDAAIWSLAKKRVAFRYYLFIYIIVNTFLWGIWFLNPQSNTNASWGDHLPWPLWPTFFWGIGIVYNYFEMYKFKSHQVEKEYQKLKKSF